MSASFITAPHRRGLLFMALAAIVMIAGGGFWYAHASINDKSTGHTINDGSDVGVMLGLADQAYRDKHLLSPVGSNVYEFYFSVLQLDPNNTVAQRRLRDSFKPACDSAENAINGGDLDEAQRELSLLRMYDPHNYQLALLGGVLDAQLIIERHKHEAEAARIQAQQLSAN